MQASYKDASATKFQEFSLTEETREEDEANFTLDESRDGLVAFLLEAEDIKLVTKRTPALNTGKAISRNNDPHKNANEQQNESNEPKTTPRWKVDS